MFIIDLMLRMYTDPVLNLDRELLTEHLAEVRAKKERLMEKIDQSIGREALMSNPQFAEVLKKLGVEPPTKISLRTNKETYAFGKTDVAFKALLEHEDERVQAVVAARLGIKSTLEETRTESFIGIADRGCLPIMLNYYGAHTGRASGGDKVNLQNLPRGGALRHAIKAPEGHVLVASDSSQIEARVVAWLAGQDELVAAFAEGRDIYSEFATSVYGKTVTKADKVERFVGKTCILGLGYGMGKDKFQTTLKVGQGGIAVEVDMAEAERIVTLYRTKYSKIVELWGEAQKALKAMVMGYEYTLGIGVELRCTKDGIELPNGMWVRYPNLRMSDGQAVYDSRYGATKIYGGKVVENVVQALARIVVFDQMALIDKKFRQFDAPQQGKRMRTALTVHDEVVAVVPEPARDKALSFMTKVMTMTPSWAKGLPVACEADAAESYGECK
jgi:DNA polymerase